tara:strand:- start:559 stop:978 length:420 start_codon:yes stop_codon:yes gene_type:complete
MPNWCTNELEIYGDKEKLKTFKGNVNSKQNKTSLCLEKLCPIKRDGVFDNYTISDIWGTKWNVEADCNDMAEQLGMLTYRFDSAWSPPRGAILTGSKKYPSLRFILRYDEPGMQYAGIFMCQNGKIVKDECIDSNWPEE